jgi:hypothetical protein
MLVFWLWGTLLICGIYGRGVGDERLVGQDFQKTGLTSRQVTSLARTSSHNKLHTRPLVREGATT